MMIFKWVRVLGKGDASSHTYNEYESRENFFYHKRKINYVLPIAKKLTKVTLISFQKVNPIFFEITQP